jgi:hypothetical protein
VRLVTQIVEYDFADLRCDLPLQLCFRMLEPIKRAPFARRCFVPRRDAFLVRAPVCAKFTRALVWHVL